MDINSHAYRSVLSGTDRRIAVSRSSPRLLIHGAYIQIGPYYLRATKHLINDRLRICSVDHEATIHSHGDNPTTDCCHRLSTTIIVHRDINTTYVTASMSFATCYIRRGHSVRTWLELVLTSMSGMSRVRDAAAVVMVTGFRRPRVC